MALRRAEASAVETLVSRVGLRTLAEAVLEFAAAQDPGREPHRLAASEPERSPRLGFNSEAACAIGVAWSCNADGRSVAF